MKKWHLILIAIGAICVLAVTSLGVPYLVYGGVLLLDGAATKAEIEIDSYRLCQDANGKDVIIIKYLLKNQGKTATSLFYEGDFYVYQNGIQLMEYYEELPQTCAYDAEDQMKNIKGGVEYYAEIAYSLENTEDDVEVEVDDYGLFDGKKQKVFAMHQSAE